MLRQSALLIFFTIVFLSAFLFFVLPFSLRIYTAFTQKSGTFGEKDTIPPQTPVLFALPEATNSAELTVSGFGEASTEMTLVNNGTAAQQVTADAAGEFTFSPLQLTPGENQISVLSQDAEKNESTSNTQTVFFDTKAPTLTVSEPQDGTTITRRREQVITVKGVSDPNARITLNDKLLFVDRDGNFSGTFQLSEGDNTLKLRAVSAAGNAIEQEVKVAFRP